MRFITHYTFLPQSRNEVLGRFQETGGPPPEGVKMIGRWHATSGNEGWVLSETDDAVAQSEWILGWSDHLEFTTTPVTDDDEFVAALQRTM